MATSLFSLSSLTLLTLAILLSFSSPAFSTSRRALDHIKYPTGFRVTLHPIDAGGNYTKFQRFQRALARGRNRLQRLNGMVLADDSVEVRAPVHAGNGEFLMKLAIGTPPESYMVIMDTGSDLIWTQCEPCIECFKQSSPIYDPRRSSSFSKMSCSTALCAALPQSKCSDGCEYMYMYGDDSSTEGFMGTETFTFDKHSVGKIGFGCGVDNEGDGFTQGSGLVGLGRGPVSLVSQLREPKFSYCLTSVADPTKTSTLLLGSLASAHLSAHSKSVQTTPLLKNKLQPSFYYLNLQGISVGHTRLPFSESSLALHADGSGGLIIDSGTTITYLEQSVFDMIKNEFISQTNLNVNVDAAEFIGLDLCFSLPSYGGATSVEVPKLVFYFEGADLDLPGENYMMADSGLGVVCLAMGGSSGMSIFGNVQQQNMLVLHDLEKETLSFSHTQCDKI